MVQQGRFLQLGLGWKTRRHPQSRGRGRGRRGFPWVCSWALTACAVRISKAAYGSCLDLPDLQLLTAAQCRNVLALYGATMWLGVAGAGAAVLASVLEGRRARTHRALAGVALASAAAIHCAQACLLGVTLITGASEDLLAVSVFWAVCVAFFATFDVNAARVLLRRRPGGEEEEEKKQAATLQEKHSKYDLEKPAA